MKKKEDGFSGHVKEKGRGLGISAIFIKITKTSQKLVFGVVNNYFS
ncbi:TPA: hypothetical protein ACXF7Z_004573 [Klebsiella pneumoniae]|nr:hypothetical protein [Klebsiella pneumoniae]EMC8835152.1 hypothetical protein [Klebsiella pneumoniae]